MKNISIYIIILVFFNVNLAFSQNKDMSSKKIELIVVFKKDVPKQETEKLLKEADVEYREGMDSSRGKIYFYKTGEKYILTFKDELKKKEFIEKYQKYETIYEIYTPNWEIQKD